MTVLNVKEVGKSFRSYASEIRRMVSWFGFNPGPIEDHWVLKDISFSVKKGESLALIGRNGAGKSTLLKLITGIQRPSDGSIVVNGQTAAILELGLGFNLEFSGSQNAVNGLGLWGFSSSEIEQVLPSVEEFADVGKYFYQPVRIYSSGMQMRLAFAVATAFRPDILIVDEALSVGDSNFQAKCYKRINDFIEQGTSLLLVTHSISDVLKHCDRAIYIDSGKIVVDGPPKDVVNLYLDNLSSQNSFYETDGLTEKQVPSEFAADDLFSTRAGYRKGEHRWEASGAKIIDFETFCNGQHYPQLVISGSTIDLRFKVLFERDFEKVVPGILIKTVDGIYIYGANSLISSDEYEALRASEGELVCYRFLVNLPLAEGAYLISLGISSGDDISELVPLDRRYDSILFEVARTKGFAGMVDLNARFSVEEGFSRDE